MSDGKSWKWEFLGFKLGESCPVQSWFDNLPVDVQDEISDLLETMANVTDRLWRRPEYDPLDGEPDISEIRPEDVRAESGITYYRMYGYFGPGKHQYTFLHATDKEERNDKDGKRIARQRLEQLRRNEAGVHKLDFEGRSSSATPPKSGNKS